MNQLIENIYINYSVYFLEGLLLTWLYFLFLNLKNISKKSLIRFSWCVLIGLAISSIIFYFGNVDFKILSDETNLLSVSRAMVDSGKMFNTIDSVIENGSISPIVFEVPTRGALFPYFIAIIHRLIGTKTGNVFILNFLSLSFLITIILYYSNELKLQYRIFLIMLLILSPAIFIFSTSGGFDLFSFSFAILCLVFVKKYFENSNKNSLNLVLFTSICFSSIRYESIVGALFIWVLIIMMRKKEILVDLKDNYFLFLIPLFFLPVLTQRYLTWGKFENPVGTDAFSLFNLSIHLGEFLKAWFIMWQGPYPIIIHWIGLIGILVLLRKKNTINSVIYKLSFTYIIFVLFLLLSHHLGKALFPTQVRLFIPISSFFIFSAIYFVNSREDKKLFVFVFIILFQIIVLAKYSWQDKLTEELTLTRETQTLRKLLATNDFKNVQFIYDRPGQFYAFGYAALGFSYLSEHQSYKIPSNIRLIAITRKGPDNPTPVISERLWESRKLLSFQLTDYTTVYFEELHSRPL